MFNFLEKITIFTFFLLIPSQGIAATLTVPDDYLTIQAAVDAAVVGDEIHVSSGEYNDIVSISKEVNIVGENKETTIIDRSGEYYGFKIYADNVKVSGFTIRNVKNGGIYLSGASGCRFENIIITNVRGQNDYTKSTEGYGLQLIASSNNNFNTINISDVQGGRYNTYPSGYKTGNGISLEQDSNNNMIINCTISNITGGMGRGIRVQDSTGNHIKNNEIFDIFGKNGHDVRYYTDGFKAYGIAFENSSNCTIESSRVTGIKGGDHGCEDSGWCGDDGIGFAVVFYNCTDVSVSSSSISEADYGIYFQGNVTGVIGGRKENANAIFTNSFYDLYNNTSDNIDASCNSWSSQIPDDNIFDKLDDSSKGRVSPVSTECTVVTPPPKKTSFLPALMLLLK